MWNKLQSSRLLVQIGDKLDSCISSYTGLSKEINKSKTRLFAGHLEPEATIPVSEHLLISLHASGEVGGSWCCMRREAQQ